MSEEKKNKLSPELEELFASKPALSKAELRELEEAGRALDDDPQFLAEVIKSTFINEVYVGMEERGENKSTLARKWKRSRQYLSNLLNEDKRVNFTVETMVELVHLLGKRLELHVVGKEERCHMLRCEVPARTVNQAPLEKRETDQCLTLLPCDSHYQTSTKIIRGNFNGTRRHQSRELRAYSA